MTFTRVVLVDVDVDVEMLGEALDVPVGPLAEVGVPCAREGVLAPFPSVKSLERLVGAVMCEQDEIWADSRYFSEEKMSELYEGREAPRQPDAEEQVELGRMAQKAIEASLELADRMEAA